MISKETCVKFLENLTLSNNVKLISFEIKPISENVEGFMGEHFKLIIKYEFEGTEKSHQFFVKNKPVKNETQREMTNSLGFYKREIFIYDNLLRKFEEYGYDTSFAAKCYYCIPEESLIMEDITLNGFSLGKWNTYFTMQQMECALKSLAKYHAAAFAFERTKSKQLNRQFNIGKEYSEYMFEAFFNQYIKPEALSNQWWTSALKSINALIDYLPENAEYKLEFKTLLNMYDFGKIFVTETKYKKTCGHGDLWSNNLLFKNDNNIAIDCRLVDFQISRYFFPSFDVLLLIYSNSNTEFRSKNMEELFNYYYNTLSQILMSYGYEINEFCPRNEFYETMDLVIMEVLLQVLMINFIVFLPKEKLNEVTAEDEAGFTQVMFDNTVNAVTAFQENEVYRNTIIDTMYVLRDALCKNARK